METRKRNVAPNASTDKPEPPASAQTPPAAKQRTTGSEDVLTKTLGIIALVAVSLLAGSLLLAVAGRLRPHTHRRVHCSAAVSPSYACPLTPAQRDALSEGGDCGLPPACDAPYAAHDTWAHVRMVDRVPSVQVVNFTRMRGNAPKRTLLIGPSGPCALPVKNITVLSTDPYVIVIDGFITDDEADTVKAEGCVPIRLSQSRSTPLNPAQPRSTLLNLAQLNENVMTNAGVVCHPSDRRDSSTQTKQPKRHTTHPTAQAQPHTLQSPKTQSSAASKSAHPTLAGTPWKTWSRSNSCGMS